MYNYLAIITISFLVFSCKPKTETEHAPHDTGMKGPSSHTMLGTHGCIPKSNLILTARGNFKEFPITDASTSKIYFYVAFDSVFIHVSGKVKPDTFYSPGYLRSDTSVIKHWNDKIKASDCTSINYGVGVCDIPTSTGKFRLKDNGMGMFYFEDGALFCDKNQIYPPGKNCEFKEE